MNLQDRIKAILKEHGLHLGYASSWEEAAKAILALVEEHPKDCKCYGTGRYGSNGSLECDGVTAPTTVSEQCCEKCRDGAKELFIAGKLEHWIDCKRAKCPCHSPSSGVEKGSGYCISIGDKVIHTDPCTCTPTAVDTPKNPMVACKQCYEQHGVEAYKYCKHTDTPTTPVEPKTYERDYSHTHCWAQKQPPACGIPLDKHTQCCLCDTPVEPTAPVGGSWESEFDKKFMTIFSLHTGADTFAPVKDFIAQTIKNREREIAEGVEGLPNVTVKTIKGNLETEVELKAVFRKDLNALINKQ